MVLSFVFLFCLLLSHVSTQSTDLTTVPGANGVNVVRAVLSKLDASRIFDQSGNADLTNVFLRNMAYVESRDGVDFDTHLSNMDGGIWKITARQFQLTKQLPSRHRQVYAAIMNYLGQDWLDVEYRDLAKPLYSGLAARLYLTYFSTLSFIPPTARQGGFWSDVFKGGKGNIQRWLDSITSLRQIEVCSLNTDVVFVLDSSGSINYADPTNYDKIKNYTRAFVDALIDGSSRGEGDRVGIVIYGTEGEVQLPLSESESLDKRTLLNRIDNIPYLRQWTNTADGLCRALEQPWRDSLSVLRLLITLTDGQSNRDSPQCGNTSVASELVHSNDPPLLSYVIGVANANEDELLMIASAPELIDHLDTFNMELFTAAQEARSYQICFTVDQPQRVGRPVEGTAGRGESVRISFELPAEEGITIRFCIHEGQIIIYAATSVPNPSAAIHDWSTEITAPQFRQSLTCSTTFFGMDTINNVSPGKSTSRSRRQAEAGDTAGDTITIYITIEGQQNFNEFSLNSTQGEYNFDIDECLVHPCHVNANCNNTDGGYECECKDGFTGDGVQCSDIDECAQNEPLCHINALCQNTEGGFTCECAQGYDGDGTSECQDTSMRLFIILLPTVNGLFLILLLIFVVVLVSIKCRSRQFEGSRYKRRHSTLI